MKRIKVWINKTLNKYKYALVDDDDYENLSKHIWRFNNTGYPNRRYESGEERYDKLHPHKKTTMHREIMKWPDQPIDHINRNKLDNMRSNLRVTTNTINCFNRPTRIATSKFRGVYKHNDPKMSKKPWVSQININKKRKHLGYYKTEIDAAIAYNVTAQRFYGEFATLNRV